MTRVTPSRAEDLLNPKEAAAYIGMSKSWLDQGRIRGFGPALLTCTLD
ncbi:MAG: hypothetical protein HOI35_18040 [Woeseia sp.]|jgi:hypothetical protein|nr:hypothetical protein [Woeseia sp.]MBT6211905.1 hypothetical protein [Woeseia sp.]